MECVEDCHEVLTEFLFGAFVTAALNDESATNLIDDPLEDFGRNAGKLILVGNHNFFDCSALHKLQKPRVPFSLVDVEDFVTLVGFLLFDEFLFLCAFRFVLEVLWA